MSDLATRRVMELSGSMTTKALTSLGPLPLSGLHGPPAIVVAPANSGANAAIARPPAAERLAWMKARRERAIVIGIGLKSWRVRRRDARRRACADRSRSGRYLTSPRRSGAGCARGVRRRP